MRRFWSTRVRAKMISGASSAPQLPCRHALQPVARDHPRAGGADQVNLTCDGQGGRRMIARDHDHLDTGGAAPGDRRGHFELRRVLEPDEAQEGQALFQARAVVRVCDAPGRQGEDAKAVACHGFYALPEGTPVFANEPILEVSAPIAQAQLAETFVMNQVHLQTVLASKAARVVTAAVGRSVVDFGPRRMHGIDAAINAARAFHIAGVAATSNTLAGQIYGVPVAGTMAHSFVQAAANEMEAFRAFMVLYPETILRVDGYDTLQGVGHVIALARELGEAFKVRAVRLDFGRSRRPRIKETRAMLDEAGLHHVEILASGGLDEEAIAEIVAKGAPITGFGVGTSMGVSQDAPGLDIAYKLCAYGGRGRLKLFDREAGFAGPQTGVPRRGERPGGPRRHRPRRGDFARPPVAASGDARCSRRLSEGTIDLHAPRRHAQEEIARLPGHRRAIQPAKRRYPVEISETLQAYQGEVTREVGLADGDAAATTSSSVRSHSPSQSSNASTPASFMKQWLP